MSGGEKKYVVGGLRDFFKKDCQNVVISSIRISIFNRLLLFTGFLTNNTGFHVWTIRYVFTLEVFCVHCFVTIHTHTLDHFNCQS